MFCTFSARMDSDEETLLLALLLRRRKRIQKQIKRRIWEDPLSSYRLGESDYYVLFCKRIKNYPKKFRSYLRMTRPTFYELLHLIQNDLRHEDTHLRLSVTPEERLVITIRYLATGCSLMDLHFSFRRGFSTVQKIVRETCQTIIKKLFYICMPPNRTEDWENMAKGFLENADFPNCLGAVDGKHIRMIKPCHSGSLYFNYKKYFSMNLLAVCDSNYKFIFVDVGSYGKSADSTIFTKSQLRYDIDENRLNIPQPRLITNNEMAFPFTFIGDEAFPLSNYMQRPYTGNYLSLKQRVYNYRLSRARRYIECTFGIMSNKWRIFHRLLNVGLDFSEEIVKTCCILHNFVRSHVKVTKQRKKVPRTIGLYNNSNNDENVSNLSGIAIRNKFADYFVSNEGAVPWQNKYV